MAQQDATEQVKEVLRQLIKYRFWIAVSFAALFATIAYFMGAGPVQKAAADETGKIKSAESSVKKYASPGVPTDQYKPIIDERTQLEDQDVKKAWKELYDRQAPLLNWPETVEMRFRKWGRKWPENEDPAQVQLAYIDYGHAYKDYVDLVFKTFKPFDYETGEGIVASPGKEVLLRPVQFSDDERPDLGKIWAAQERLWLQRTLLQVVADVNKNAKDWDTAIIKQVESVEVGNPTAQDQKSLAKSEELKKADEILAPGQESAAAAAEGGGGAMAGAMAGAGGGTMPAGMGAMMQGGRRGGMGGMAPGGMGGGGGGPESGSQYDSTIYSITPPIDKGQYRVLPVRMTVLIDQDRVQDLLVALENSPMSIQVMEPDLARPQSRVTKPEKGHPPGGANMMGGMMSMMSMMAGGQAGYGGRMGQMDQMMRSQMMGGMGMQGGRLKGGGYPGMGGMGAATTARKGTDVRNAKRAEERKKTEKEVEEKRGPSLFDPYFEIVELTVYGRARFYNPPPIEPGTESSAGATPTADATAPAAPGGAAAPQAPPENAAAAKAAGTPTPAPGADAAKKAAAPAAEGNAPPKGATEKPGDAAKPDAKAAAAPAQAAPEKPAGKPADAAKPDTKAATPKS